MFSYFHVHHVNLIFDIQMTNLYHLHSQTTFVSFARSSVSVLVQILRIYEYFGWV